MEIIQGQHWAIVGKTGSGKTYFAKELLRKMSRSWPNTHILIIDSKRKDDFADWQKWYWPKDVIPSDMLRRQRFIVWRPTLDNSDLYEDTYRKVLMAGIPCVVMTDELSMIGGKDGNSYPLSFQRLLKVGRQPPSVTMVNLTQELANGPRQVIGQCTHGLLFKIQNAYDVRKFWSSLDRTKIGDTLPKTQYGFWYVNSDTGIEKLYADSSRFFH